MQCVVEKQTNPYANFPREVSEEEADLRLKVINTAKKYIGLNEADGSHKQIIDQYNSHEPLAIGYRVSYTDAWCSTFVSAISIECGLTSIIPTECGCDRHIQLFKNIGSWIEDDTYVPLPGDLIFYTWKPDESQKNCVQPSDHVGIVMGVAGSQIIVIEGNYMDSVGCRVVALDAPVIRGFAAPDYSSLLS